ncbi:MAG TPA: hypothetical protein VGS19_03900 [Streptosporangiaceae bacterium]|nr:hypothetical protein [Streptosporangiaceae bacterium]
MIVNQLVSWTGPCLAARGQPGRLVEVFYRQANGGLGHVYQIAANGSTGWSSPSTMGGTVLGSPKAFVNASGTPEVLSEDSNRQLAHTYHSGSVGWVGWVQLGGSL